MTLFPESNKRKVKCKNCGSVQFYRVLVDRLTITDVSTESDPMRIHESIYEFRKPLYFCAHCDKKLDINKS